MTRIEAIRHLTIRHTQASHWLSVRYKEDRVLKDRLNHAPTLLKALAEGADLRASQIIKALDELTTKAGFKSATDEHVQLVRSA